LHGNAWLDTIVRHKPYADCVMRSDCSSQSSNGSFLKPNCTEN